MKRVLMALVVCVPLLAAPSNAQDFETGLAAAERGDYEAALREWRPLANKGDAEAQYYLGSMYDRGIGVQQNYAEAAKWYRRAAELGDPDAQNNLGAMYINGNGVPLDYVQAHMWFNLAAARDNHSANENRDFIAKQMTPADLSKAERMALEWRKKHRR
jgi:TPR repeat protein